MKKPLLLGSKGCGNAIAESAFALAGIPIDYEEVDYSADSPTRPRLLAVNPLGQVPALVLPNGTVMTETLAIIHHVNDHAPGLELIPPVGDAARDTFYRWAVFIIAALYPTFTYGDDPKKWVPDEEGSKMLRESTNRHREALWKELEAAAGTPWFLGERMSALDLYFASMVFWRPGRKWFDANAPKISAIAKRAGALESVAPIIKRNFA
ncbi:MAG TPA: glutathione S-transferase family protein [Usitatibacter sp.]|jgi:GST-like protein